MSSPSKINSQQFPEIHILISILLKPLSNGNALYCNRTFANFLFPLALFLSSSSQPTSCVCACVLVVHIQVYVVGFGHA